MVPKLGSGQVHVWWARPVELDPGRHLSAEERTRYDGYRSARAAAEFLAARTLTRRVLGDYLGVEPQDVPLTIPAPGHRPEVEESDLHFSITHTHGQVGVAVARSFPVGLDIDHERTVSLEAVSRIMSAVERNYLADRRFDRASSLIRFWVRREAVLKATGFGIGLRDMNDFEVSPPWELASVSPAPGKGPAQLVDLSADKGFYASLATLADGSVQVIEGRGDGLLAS